MILRFKYLFLTLFILVIPQESAGACDLLSPAALSVFSSTPVYSITQDSHGAMWFNTESGPYRFNGHTLTLFGQPSSSYLSRFATVDGERFYLNQPDALVCFHTDPALSSYFQNVDPPLPEQSPLLAEGDSLVYARYNIVCSNHDGVTSELASLEAGVFVRSLQRLPSGELLAATFESGIGVISDGVFHQKLPLGSRIQSTFLSDDGSLWVGTSNDGLLKVDTQDYTVVSRFTSPDAHPMIDVRYFAKDKEGNLYFGSASGLFRLGTDGAVMRIPIDGAETNSVCDVFIDRDGNLWVGTYDNGVYFANLKSFPFEHLTSDHAIGVPRGLALSGDGTLWVASDPDGLLYYRDGKWYDVPSMEEYKFQSAYFDSSTGNLFLGNWDGMVRFDPLTGKHALIRFSEEISVGYRIPVFAICRYGGQLLLGTTVGAFLYDPASENMISRRVEGVNTRIKAIARTSSGGILLGGNGLYRIEQDDVECLAEFNGEGVSDLKFTNDGGLWVALDRGAVMHVDSGGGRTFYDKSVCGLPDAAISYVEPLPDGRVVAGTSRGISILDPATLSCRNYDRNNGIRIKASSRGGSLSLPDGKVALGGNGAIEILAPSSIPGSDDRVTLCVDAVTINGKPLYMMPGKGTALVLDHTSATISFDVADFDYSGVGRHVYSYILEGADSEWHEFDIASPISCTNLSPGRYRLRVRESYNLESVRAEVSLPVRILPAWYLSRPFIVLWLLIISGIASFLIYIIHARNLLRRSLSFEKEQNARQSRFFLDLSLRMRTPLNLMIGQMERYFKEYGSRARGIEDIQDVYGHAAKMREVISDFVDDSNESLEKMPKYSKVLNAAAGVVERNLFSENLNVPFLCKELNMGKTKLTETLREASGMSPREFIEDIRLRHAAHMMQDGNHTVAEVSDILGFSSPDYFTLRFKRKFGCPPSTYRRDL